ncbi:MAG: hypothetical protein GF417_10235 [Candidatus Latescibacteria bacterium]|nr:hypothetical protein [bacterium]MBD3424805.1 hypothetical protein [Candidatus Latescibacterota bacterium]
MKPVIKVLFFSLILFSFSVANAGAPIDGTYMTMNGTLLPGRVSEAWCSYPTYKAGVPGNMQNAMSWDGSDLETQWRVWGMAIDQNGAVLNAEDIDGNGDGYREYITHYNGGKFWLSGAHIWGDEDYYGTLDYYRVTSTMTIQGGQVVGIVSNVYFTGVFDDYAGCAIDYTIASAIRVWASDSGDPKPADYPPFICSVDQTGGYGSDGELFDGCCITCNISCETDAEKSSWGAVKSFYRE